MSSEEARDVRDVIRDVRLDYIGGLVQNLLRVSEEKWTKLVQAEEARVQMTTKFLDDPESEVALVSECGSGGSLVICLTAGSLPSSRQQQKVVYFLKGLGTVVTPENVKEVITCGDLTSVTVEHLQAFLDYAVVPTLCNPSCHEGWSRESAADLLGSVRSFRGLVARAVAQNRGHVIITVPPLQPFQITVFARSEGVLTDAKSSWIRESVSVLESSVHQWAEQIQEVLEQKLEGSSQQHPEPAHHYKFWCRRGKSLRFIRDQLRSDALKVVAEILHSANSPSDVHLQQLIRLVEDAVTEAEDIEMHLISLYLRCKDLEAKDLPRLRHNLVDGLLRMVKEAVEHCVSLQQPHNATIVTQIYASIANILVHLSQQFLDGATLFRGELDDSEQRLDLVLIIMDHLRRSRIDNDAFSIREQNDRLEMFAKRLKSIKVVFETASAFLRLVKTEIGGIHGHVTACQIRNIYDEFQEQLVVFDKCPYDILEPDTQEFQKDIELFHRRIADLDERLGSIIKGCVLSCSSVEAMSKVLQVCEFLLKRPSIRDVALSACEKHVLDTARKEMDSLLMKFLEQVKKDKASLLPVHLSLPQTSRILQWVTDIKELLNFTKQSIDDISHLFISKKVVEGLVQKHRKLSSTFTKSIPSQLT